MENYVGSDAYGYGFLANKAVWHNKAKLHSYGEIFKQGDVIQVTLDCNANTLAFSRNGEYLGIAASDLCAGTSRSGPGSDGNCKWYPAFSMYNKDDKVTLVPPSAVSVFSTKEGRSQNASMFDLIDAMQDVLAYQNHLTGVDSTTTLFEKVFEEFEDWRRGEKLFREISHGQVITIDKSTSATDKYGLANGDSVFTSKGQCTVLGEYRHELWYEVDEGGSSALFGTSCTQLASWSLNSCREMLESPDEYPVHRHHKYNLEMEINTIGEIDSFVKLQDSTTDTTEQEIFSFKTFADAQIQWRDSNTSVAEADAKLIAELDAIASSQGSSSPIMLSYADVSTALLLERMCDVNGMSAVTQSNQTIARIGLLLFVNRCLYNVVRIAMTRNIFATTLGVSENPEYLSNQSNSSKQLPLGGSSECQQVSSVAALLSSPHWTIDDPSAFNWIPAVAARLLFASQKEKLVDEELRTTKTTNRTLDSLKDPNDNEDNGMDSDLPMIKINYPLSRPPPFWECSSALLKKKSCFCLSSRTDSSVFVQLAKQLVAQDARQWRRESSQPFEAIPISQAFHVHVEKASAESSGTGEKNDQQQQDEDDEDQLQQPSSKQTARYLEVFEYAVGEIQCPRFPLFAPNNGSVEIPEGKPRHPLQLDINVELFSPSALAHSRVQSSQLLLWYFCFGQILGIAWRSKILLPLQFLSQSYWEELVSPANPCDDGSSRVREAAIRATRDGLFSIIPSRCVALLSGNNPSLRDRLSDLDVRYVTRLDRHATYAVPRQSHHELFWMTVKTFTSVERRMLEHFINPERRTGAQQIELGTPQFPFVLEIADALADGRDHPDSCYPVVVSTGPHSSRLHLPAYSSTQTLRSKLVLAMTNIPFM
ncbi:hypothetical protein PHMEG_0003262 [Phytophthora megakarya]|uniref:HECT E3 ubiquitin ligase n=1 Tax=Phytophthora megakarya TaxID=4795 RepID=A0A225WWQ4_9STRA|nr:hypothetical protein PHMEG_0003262 [Phytophthora megakarya]